VQAVVTLVLRTTHHRTYSPRRVDASRLIRPAISCGKWNVGTAWRWGRSCSYIAVEDT
jgi:hypothetical protein